MANNRIGPFPCLRSEYRRLLPSPNPADGKRVPASRSPGTVPLFKQVVVADAEYLRGVLAEPPGLGLYARLNLHEIDVF